MLAERGWKGILLEPSPKAYAKLKEIYKGIDGVYTYPFAIGNHNGTAILNESASLINSHDVALVSTFKEEEMQRFRSITSYTPVEVKVFRWKTFLNRVKYKTFDFISIDVEGMELYWVDESGVVRQGVLPQIDLTETKMVCVEWNGKQKEEFIAACPGFRLIHENEIGRASCRERVCLYV